MADTPAPQETSTIPLEAQRPANALLLATMGPLAIILFFWGTWCLDWLNTTLAFNIIVIASLTLVHGYAIQLVRFYKRLQLPPLSIKGRIKAWLYWAIVGLFVLQVIWKQKGYVAGLLGIVTLVEALAAFIHFLSARFDRRLALLSALQSILHAFGWLFYLGMAVYGMDRYARVLDESVNLLAGFPPGLQNAFCWCAQSPKGVALTCLFALCLVGLSLMLRYYLYSRQGNMPLKALLNPLGKKVLVCFVLAISFNTFTMVKLHSRWMDAIHEWSNDPAISNLASSNAQSDAALKFAEEQKALGETLVSLAHQEADEDAPYAWGRYCRQSDDERLKPWYPPEMGPDAEDRKALAKYLDQLSPSLEQLDALLKSLETIRDAQIAGGTYILAEWRFHACVELGRRDDALRALADLATIACYQAVSLDMTHRLRGIHRIVLWTENQKRLPQDCKEALQEEAKNLKNLLDTLPHGPAIDSFVKETHEKLQTLRAEYRDWGITMPFFYMLTTADDIQLLHNFRNIDTPAKVPTIQKKQRTICLYSSFVQIFLTRIYRQELETALARLEQF